MAGAISGRKAQVLVSGAAVPMVDEATTTLVANTQFYITNAAKRVLDRSAAVTVKKDAVAQASNLYTINRLTGTVTFLADIGGGHTVTVSGSYLPMSVAAQAKDYTYELGADMVDVTKFGDAFVNRIQGLKDVSGTLSGWRADTYFSAALLAGAPVAIELWTDSSTAYDLRVWALLARQQVSAALESAVEENIDFVGATDVDLREIGG